jgi:glycosyltransferase involved in cell wall biosynthesis
VTDEKRRRALFLYFKDTPQRRGLFADRSTSCPSRYSFLDPDQFSERGLNVDHNLALARSIPPGKQAAWDTISRTLHAVGARGGDFAGVASTMERANRADVILSTVDPIGIPLVTFAALGMIRPPIVYVSIGLPMRMRQVTTWARFLYRRIFRRVSRIVAYGFEEAAWLDNWLGFKGNVRFVPYGVDADYFCASGEAETNADVLSVGADINRDFPQLISCAGRNSHISVKLVTNREHLSALGQTPSNLKILSDVPITEIRAHYAAARVIALPVKENEYSGATTTLLQAMAMGKPVVVSNVGAIRSGYGLKDGENCRLAPPGDSAGFERAIMELLANPELAARIGANARAHVINNLTWKRYMDDLTGIIMEALQDCAK